MENTISITKEKKWIEGTTESGFEFKIEDGVLDDMELLEKIAKSEKGEPFLIFEVLDEVLGEEQKKKLYNFIRNDDGRVTIENLNKELTSIFLASGENVKKD